MKLRQVFAALAACCALHAFAQSSWQAQLEKELPLMGHRNWIAIVDSAYPLQTSAGVETIDTGEDETAVVKKVLDSLERARQVRPVVFMDAELRFKDAAGVTKYPEQIGAVLGKREVNTLLHERLIHQLGEAGASYHVLVLKTTLTIPYSSVFLRLDCKYWSDDAEARMREAMKAALAAGHP